MAELKKGPIRGYKCFDMNLACKGFQFEIGKAYEHIGDIEMCKTGFHFHENGSDLFRYYERRTSRVCEVIAHDVITGDDKSVCRRIEVIKGYQASMKILGHLPGTAT